MKLTLNKKELVLSGGIRYQKIPQYSPQVRSTGEQLRSDKSPIPEWAPEDLSQGLGRKYWRRDRTQYHFGSAMTLWARQITLPLLPQEATFSGTALVQMDYTALHKGIQYGFYKEGQAIKCATWDGSSWTIKSTVVATGVETFVGVSSDTSLLAYYGVAGGDVYSTASTDGTTWVAVVAVTGKTPAAVAVSPTLGREYCATTTGAGQVKLYKSDDDGATWAAYCSGSAWSLYGATGTAIFLNNAGDETPYVSTSEMVFQVTTTAFVPAVSMQGISSLANGRGMTVWGSLLVIPSTNGAIFFYQADGTVTPFGLDSGDGLPADYRGDVTALCADRWLLFAAVHATQSGVYVFDGQGWHPMWLSLANPTINSLTTSGISKPSLLFSPSKGEHLYLQNYHSNPLEMSDTQYDTQAWIDYPIYGGNLPETKALFYYLSAHARDLLTGNEELSFYLGLDGEDPTTFVGKITEQGTKLWLPSELSSGRTMQLRVWLTRRASSTYYTPVFHYPILGTTRAGDTLLSLVCDVDITSTASSWGKPVDTVLAELETLRGPLELEWRDRAVMVDMQGMSVRESDSGLTAQLTLVQL